MHMRREDIYLRISLIKYKICVTLLKSIYIMLQLNLKCKFTFVLRF
jgi:hypothetical protein